MSVLIERLFDHEHPNDMSDAELDLLREVAYVTTGLSLLGSGFILVTFLLFKEVRREFGAQLIFFLNLTDFCMSISWLPWGPWTDTDDSDILCSVQASALQYFEVVSSLWAFCIALTLMLFFKREDLSPRMSLYHALCWLFPVPIIGACLYLDLFGYAGAYWCWVKNPRYRLLVYSPSVIVVLANQFVFVWIFFKSKQSAMFSPLKKKIFAYMFAGIICLLPALANRLQNFIQPEKQMFFLFLLQASFQPLQGFVNSIVYGLTDDHYQAQYRKWKFFRKVVPQSLNINSYEDEVNQPLALEFDYENGSHHSYQSFGDLTQDEKD